MIQRTALIIAAATTAFVLVLAGSAAAYITNSSILAPAATPITLASGGNAAPVPDLDPTALQQVIRERDATYQQRIQQANDQLEQAYHKQQELATELNQAHQQAPVAQQAPATYAVSGDTAARIALRAARGATLTRAPELVSFQGVAAYEVTLDRGTIYVDANSGQVLSNGAAVTLASDVGGGHHEDGEDEGGGGDD
jgi:uncharacterized membrane protein YkoI